MNLQFLLEQKNMSVYRLSKLSGIPKTTVFDICSGKSSIEGCSAKTVFLLSKALDCSMEELMKLDTTKYDTVSGRPLNKSYLEKGLPKYLEKSLHAMKETWKVLDNGGEDHLWDAKWCELNADLNSAEVEQEISKEQAWYLREKYLRMEQ